MNRVARIFLSLLCFLPTLAQAAAPSNREEARQALAVVLQEMAPGGQALSLGDPKMPDLLAKGWRLMGERGAAYLDAHPAATAPELAKELAGLSADKAPWTFSTGVVRLNAEAFVVDSTFSTSKDAGATSTFMVLAKSEGKWRLAWNVKELAAAHFEKRDDLGRWAYLTSSGYGDGSLVGSVKALPSEKSGRPRFYVEAEASGQGGTLPAQVSIWAWTGKEAEMLAVGTYARYVETPKAQLVGNVLEVPTKEETKTFFSCGMCPEPRGLWRFRMGPDKVEDLGRRFVLPEVELVDNLLDRIARRAPATDLAAPAVVEKLAALFPEKDEERHFPFGMLGETKVSHAGVARRVVIDFDEGAFTFTLVERGGRPYFTAVETPPAAGK
ncbi:MAG: hypothetical protein HY901_30420 [Deltaproteobacteria bacterium]|nr:hypothetical protein [Deltaproteobacteria bacterium]